MDLSATKARDSTKEISMCRQKKIFCLGHTNIRSFNHSNVAPFWQQVLGQNYMFLAHTTVCAEMPQQQRQRHIFRFRVKRTVAKTRSVFGNNVFALFFSAFSFSFSF